MQANFLLGDRESGTGKTRGSQLPGNPRQHGVHEWWGRWGCSAVPLCAAPVIWPGGACLSFLRPPSSLQAVQCCWGGGSRSVLEEPGESCSLGGKKGPPKKEHVAGAASAGWFGGIPPSFPLLKQWQAPLHPLSSAQCRTGCQSRQSLCFASPGCIRQSRSENPSAEGG